MVARPTLGFIGAGKVGTTLARLLFARGFFVSVVYSRSANSAKVLANVVGAKMAASPQEVTASSELTFLTVPDDTIDEVAAILATTELSGKAVVHTSGVHEAGVLGTLTSRGAMIGSLHPIFPFADADQAVKGLPGAAFGVQAESQLLHTWLREIVSALDGQMLMIGKGQKALYHSALVFASNYGVTLYAIAQQLLMQVGAESEVSSLALNTLIAGMVRNLQVMGIPAALTGPLVRGDVGTIGAHLAALQMGITPDVSRFIYTVGDTVTPIGSSTG